MIFYETKLPGTFEIHLEVHSDDRGFFARSWCQREFENHGLSSKTVQCDVSFSLLKGTPRGMHFPAPPNQEAKLVRCSRGAIYDVVIDLRPQSPTFKNWIATELTADRNNMIYVPEGCAHGFLTLEEQTQVFYQMSEFYYPESARGVRWNDPAFGIAWPAEVQVISERDRNYPDFETA